MCKIYVPFKFYDKNAKNVSPEKNHQLKNHWNVKRNCKKSINKNVKQIKNHQETRKIFKNK